MTSTSQKTQLGVRLPEQVVRAIDAARKNKSRAEYCRKLIETALEPAQSARRSTSQETREALESLEETLCEMRQSAMAAERDAGRALAEIQRLRLDFATAIVGVLTKIGQAVRKKDQRQFARTKAEDFVRRVLLHENTGAEELG
jgi:uncharacterized alpha-E superfamily protein